jgi:hypothetical protein
LKDETGLEKMGRYILRAFFSEERIDYLEEPSKVVCRAKEPAEEKVFGALE